MTYIVSRGALNSTHSLSVRHPLMPNVQDANNTRKSDTGNLDIFRILWSFPIQNFQHNCKFDLYWVCEWFQLLPILNCKIDNSRRNWMKRTSCLAKCGDTSTNRGLRRPRHRRRRRSYRSWSAAAARRLLLYGGGGVSNSSAADTLVTQ